MNNFPPSTYAQASGNIPYPWIEAVLYSRPKSNKKEDWPRISIVTPSYNSSAYIEQTLCSVLSQGYPNLEYILIDGGSTDGSLEIIKKYERWLSYWVSEPDQGMYQAINKGFEHSSGEIMAWLNSDDLYLPWTLYTVAKIFLDIPRVDWLTSTTQLNLQQDNGPVIIPYSVPGYARTWFYRGEFLGRIGYIPQESTFWRRSLWGKVGESTDDSLQMAGDFELWARFWQHSNLTGTPCPLGCFRNHAAQKTKQNMDRYLAEATKILSKYQTHTIRHPLLLWMLRNIFKYTRRGGRRFGSLLSYALFDGLQGKWVYSYRYTI